MILRTIESRQATPEYPSRGAEHVERRISVEPHDSTWDDFLTRVPLGQFQQSSMWAQVKAVEGWRPRRLCLMRDGCVVGGWQLLWRDTRLGRIGYISKGPVLLADCPDLAQPALQALMDAMAELRVAAVIVQPPDDDALLTPVLSHWGFIPDPTHRVIQATLVNDLVAGLDSLNAAIHGTTRTSIRQAKRRGLVVRAGNRSDLEAFFELMRCTCRRQGVQPNPATALGLARIWDAFRPAGLVRLLLAEHRNELVAGQLCIGFGRVFTLWKKGWSGTHGDKRPNESLTHAALLDASREGFATFDFASLRPDIARTLLAGSALSAEQRSSRDFFHVQFGGKPKILPPSQILIRNRLLRAAARQLVRVPVEAARFP